MASNSNGACSTVRCGAKTGKNWRQREDEMVKDSGWNSRGGEGTRGKGTRLRGKKMDGVEQRGRREVGARTVNSRADGIQAEYRRRKRYRVLR